MEIGPRGIGTPSLMVRMGLASESVEFGVYNEFPIFAGRAGKLYRPGPSVSGYCNGELAVVGAAPFSE